MNDIKIKNDEGGILAWMHVEGEIEIREANGVRVEINGENILGNPVEIDSATGNSFWEVLGKLIRRAGVEDSSGLRRCLAGYVHDNDDQGFARNIKVSDIEWDYLRFFANRA